MDFVNAECIIAGSLWLTRGGALAQIYVYLSVAKYMSISWFYQKDNTNTKGPRKDKFSLPIFWQAYIIVYIGFKSP